LLAALFSSRLLPCLVQARQARHRLSNDCPLLGFDKRPRRTLARSPRADPWETALPWAVVMISQTAAAVSVYVNRGRGFACAKAVSTSTRRGVGISVTARTPNAGAWCGAGRRPSGRPNGARTTPSKLSTPRRNGRAVGAPPLRHNRRRSPKLRRRVVTQQKFFCRILSVIGRGAMRRPPSRLATRPSIAVGPAVRRFTGCSIVSANG
jgi:hypothetical protein